MLQRKLRSPGRPKKVGLPHTKTTLPGPTHSIATRLLPSFADGRLEAPIEHMCPLPSGTRYPTSTEELYSLMLAALPKAVMSSHRPIPELLEEGSHAYIARLQNRWRLTNQNPGQRIENYQAGISVTTGTRLHATKIKLFDWLMAIWLSSDRNEVMTTASLAASVGFVLQERKVNEEVERGEKNPGRLGLSSKSARSILQKTQEAMRALNATPEGDSPYSFPKAFHLPEGEVFIEFTLCSEFTESRRPSTDGSDEEVHRHWIKARTIDHDLLPTRRNAPTHAGTELLKRWNARLVKAGSPKSRAKLELFLDEFVFWDNHRHTSRSRIFAALLRELFSPCD